MTVTSNSGNCETVCANTNESTYGNYGGSQVICKIKNISTTTIFTVTGNGNYYPIITVLD